MPAARTLKTSLLHTTTLVGIALLCGQSPAYAASFDITTTGNPAQSLTTGETGVVEAGGGITAVTPIDIYNATPISISNSGTIKSSNYVGIFVESGSDISGGITNHASGLISGEYGIVSVSNSDVSGGVDNSGTIKGSYVGIYSLASGDVSGGITNHAGGLISGQYGIISDTRSDISGGIDNSGTIKGSSAGIYAYYHSAVSGGITNETGGTIEGVSGGAIVLDTLSGVTPIIINGGRIIGNVTDDNIANGYSPVTIGGDFATEGNFTVSSVTVSSGKTLTISSGNTVTMNTMPSSSGGIIAIGVTSTGSHGELTVTNDALDLSGLTIKVDVDATPTLTVGDTIMIASGNNTITGGPGATPLTVVDNSSAFDFQIVDGTYGTLADSADDLWLLVTAQAAAATTYDTQGNTNAATTLNGLSGSADPQLSQIYTNFSGASGSHQQNNILSSVLPDMNGAAQQAMLSVMNQSQALISQWLSGGTGMSAGNNPLNGLQGWGQVFGQHADQQTRSGIAGYHADTGGFAMGVDTGDRYGWGKIGGAVSYGRTFAKSYNANTSTSGIDSYALSAYGQYQLPQSYYLRGMATYVRGSTDTVRHDVGGVAGLDAQGNFDSNQYTLRGVLAKDYTVKGATLTPHLLMDYTHYAPDDYTETGAGGANLHVDQKATNMANVGIGATAKWQFKQASGATLTPELSGAYQYDLIGDRLTATSTFAGGGAAFTSPGATPARGQFDLGTGIEYRTSADWNLRADYDFGYRANYTSHAAQIKFTRLF